MGQAVSVHLCHRQEATNDVSVPKFESRSKHCVTKNNGCFLMTLSNRVRKTDVTM